MEEKKVYRRAGGSAPAERPGTLLALFAILLFGFALCNLLWPKRENSELEGRRLATLPAFSVETLLDGRWGQGFASYLADQVALRDQWLWLESAARAVGLQQCEEGGILLGRDGWMFTRQFSAVGGSRLERNLSVVANLAARQPGKVTFLLAPSAAVLYPEMLPAGAPMIDENAVLDDIFAHVAGAGATVVDPRQTFAEHKAESIFYKTDHHWTTLGAYYAYAQFCAGHGLAPFDRTAVQAVEVPGFYGTHYSATRRWNVQPDTLAYYPLPNTQTVYRVLGETQFEAQDTHSLVVADKLAGRDKYGAFLGGNDAYTVVEGNGEGSILVVKDSYANCFVPFLTANYAKIGVVDLRSFNTGVDAMLQSEGYDEILILYNFQTFVQDINISKLERGANAG